MKNNQLSRYGAIAKNLPFTPGKIFIVCPNTETYFADLQEQFPVDSDGVVRVYSSLSAAYDATVSGRDDIILLTANGNHALTSMLTVSKNRVHFIGLDLGGRMYGQRAKVSLGVTTAATDIGTIKNTGVGNTFKNIKFTNTNTVAEGIYSVVEGGEYALFENCEFYKETDLDETTAAELVLNGDSAQFKNCTFGSLANAQTGTTIRPVVKLANGTAGSGKVARDCYFENCLFWKNSGHTTSAFVYAAADADVERMVMFKDCTFINAKLSAAVPAQAIASAATLTRGYIIAKNCAAVNCTKVSTTTGVIVAGPAFTNATGISVNAA